MSVAVQELSTALRSGLNPVIFLLNNRGYRGSSAPHTSAQLMHGLCGHGCCELLVCWFLIEQSCRYTIEEMIHRGDYNQIGNWVSVHSYTAPSSCSPESTYPFHQNRCSNLDLAGKSAFCLWSFRMSKLIKASATMTAPKASAACKLVVAEIVKS